MTEPISTRNLDRYGSAELPWSRPRDILASDTPRADLTFFVATVRPDERPHSAGVGATWVDGVLYFTSGPGTLKSRNLAANPACSVSVRLRGIDLVLEGAAHRVTDSSTQPQRPRRYVGAPRDWCAPHRAGAPRPPCRLDLLEHVVVNE